MKIFFTADLHFCHEQIIKICNRPYKNKYEMHDKIIKQWNSQVQTDDTVWVLGDFAYNWKHPDELNNIISKLNGRIFLLKGNHDTAKTYFPMHEVDKPIWNFWYGKQLFVLSHFPLEEWDKCYYGSIHLHGHVHNTYPDSEYKKLDVGWDKWKKLLTLDEIVDIMKNRKNNTRMVDKLDFSD